MRIGVAAIAAGVMVAATTVAAPADARIVRIDYLPSKYQTYESCIDFTPTVLSGDAWVTQTKVYATRSRAGVPAYFCPTGGAMRAMQTARGVKFKVRVQVFDARELRYLRHTFTTRVRIL